MLIETREYRTNPRLLMRAAQRTAWRRSWIAVVLVLACAAVNFAVRDVPAGLALLVLGLALPPFVAWFRTRRTLAAPASKVPYVLRFSDDAMETLVAGDRRGLSPYAEFASVDEIPEGLRVWIHKGLWLLVAREAFQSDLDYAALCERFVQVGKMRRRRR